MKQSKFCAICGTEFFKVPECSQVRWDTVRKHCSNACNGVSKIGKKDGAETIANKREAQTRRYLDPEARARTGEKSREMWQDPEFRKKTTKAIRAFQKSESYIKKQRFTHIGEKNSAWQGGGNRHARYKSRRAALPTTLTEAEYLNTLDVFSNSCAYCGTLGKPLLQEHVIPVIQNGGYTKDNIVPSCKSCNTRKGGRTPEEAGMILLEQEWC